MATPVLELDDVHKHYTLGARRLEVLKGVSVRIEPGEHVLVIGPSGSGKSTLLNIIGLLDRIDSGRYTLDGQDVSGLTESQLARRRNARIGFVFQTFNLFPQFNVLGNIEVPMVYAGVPRARRRARARELAEQVGLGERLHHRPRELSGGEMQRTAIARSLANDPTLLLADEPTGNLDERTGQEIMGLFDELNRAGRTLVVVSHNPAHRQLAGRVLTMHDGELLP